MKKIMLFFMALIPLVLVSVVQLTTNIIEKTQFIAVESIVLQSLENYEIKLTEDVYYLQFPAQVYPISATNKEIVYSSSNENVAIIDENGLIKFFGFGSVTITAQSKHFSHIKSSCDFYITDDKAHSVQILNKQNTLLLNEYFYLETNVVPFEAVDKSLTFNSSNRNAFTVSPDGKVMAVGEGESVITVTTANGITDSFVIKCIIPLKGISIEEATFVTGYNLLNFPNIVFNPANATNKNVKYFTDSSMATINEMGEIEFLNAGVATFTATSVDGLFSVDYVVQYTGGYILSLDIDQAYKNINIEYVQNQIINLPIQYFPANANIANISVESSNTNVALVDGFSLIIVGGGSSVITSKGNTGSGEIAIVCQLFVNRQAVEIQAENIVSNSPIVNINYVVLPVDHTSEVSLSVGSALANINGNILEFNSIGQVVVNIRTSCGISKQIIVEYKEKDIETKVISGDNQIINVNYFDQFMILFDYSLNFGVPNYSSIANVLEYNSTTNVFKAIAGGQGVIIATDGTTEYIINVVVYRAVSDIVYSSTDVNLTGNNILTVKQNIKILANTYPSDATTKLVNFAVNNTDIANISSIGQLTFVKEGEVVVTMSADNVTKQLTIRSTLGKLESFNVAQDVIVFEDVNESCYVEISNYLPIDYAMDLSLVVYSSNNSAIASVDLSGKITAVAKGNTKIVVSIGSIVKTIDVTVKVKTTEVHFVYNDKIITSGKIIGNDIDLDYVVYPTNANNQNVLFEIQSQVATINQNGVVTFNGVGQAKIIVTTLDSGIQKDITIIKIDAPNEMLIYKQESLINNQTVIVQYGENRDFVVNLVINSDGLLDPENISYNNVIVNNNAALYGFVVETTLLEDGYFQIHCGEIDKKQIVAISFKYGEAVVSFNVEYRHLSGLSLKLDEEMHKDYGPERKLVFGNMSYVNGAYTNIMPTEKTLVSSEYNYNPVSFTRYPANNTDQLYWFSSDSEFAYVNADGALVVSTASFTGEKQVEITLCNAANKNDATITDSYTFTFVYGCNIYDTEGWVYCQSNSINIVLQSTLGTSEDKPGSRYFNNFNITTANLVLYVNLYGNGYTLNFNAITKKNDIKFTKFTTNVIIKGYNFDSTKKTYKSVCCLDGEIHYSIIQNFLKVWTSTKNKMLIKNCVIKQTSDCGLQIGRDNDGETYVENTVFYETAQTAVDYQRGKLFIKGFFDVYNFSKYSEFTISAPIKEAYQDSNLAKYIYKPAGSSVDSWEANVAIAITPYTEMLINVKNPMVSQVYFWDESSQSYLVDQDNCTGLNYEKVHRKYKPSKWSSKEYDVYIYLLPISVIGYDYIPQESKIYKAL